MRISFATALAVLAFACANVGQAQAAWTCQGPEVACGHSSKATKSVSSNKQASAAYASKAQRLAKASSNKQSYKTASYKSYKKSVTSSGNYGGGSSGMASFYHEPQMTASGVRFNPNAMTAAHRSLPFGTRVLVTNKANGRSVTVTINDRGPFIGGRIIDLSKAAAGQIGMIGSGVAPVSISVLGKG